MLQSFGNLDRYIDQDIITTVEFEDKGEYLATGDRGGRIVLFKREKKWSSHGGDVEATEGDGDGAAERNDEKLSSGYDYEWIPLYQFQSHVGEFDYLKSLEIEESISQIKFVQSAGCMQVLSCNDKTIKFWRIGQKCFRKYRPTNLSNKSEFTRRSYKADGTGAALSLPVFETEHTELLAKPKAEFKNAHAYHINSLSPNSDGETFISADDLRVIWWNLEVHDHCFNMIDLKPINMEELKEVITSATFHPTHCSQLVYSTSLGVLRLVDTRDSALVDKAGLSFEMPESTNSFFSEVTSSISDVTFSRCGKFLAARDYMTVKVWDVRTNREPVQTIEVQDNLKSCLSELYESDCIFDRFNVNFSADGKKVLTGSYDNKANVWRVSDGTLVTCHEISKGRSALDMSTHSAASNSSTSSNPDGFSFPENGPPHNPRNLEVDVDKKILQTSWHPTMDVAAIAGQSCLYLYSC